MSAEPFTHDSAGTPAAAWASRPEWRDVPDLAVGSLTDLDGAPVRRVVVVAAHPDDESLGAAGLMAMAHADGLEVELVLATLGEHSHPDSPTITPDQLAARRELEAAAALAQVAPGARTSLVGLADGGVELDVDRLVRVLVEVVGDGRGVLLVAPWSHDGHPDHDAAGRAAAAAAHRTGARCVQYPIWSWHWREPGDLPWGEVLRLPLTDDVRAAKAKAIAAHHSQVAPLSSAPGDEVLLTAEMLSHFAGAHETYVETEPVDPAFDDLHTSSDDPWGVESRWYEERKRALLLALLPRRRFRSAWEAGCSVGVLTRALAARCDEVVGTDRSAAALAIAERHVTAGVSFEHREVTTPWADRAFDLVVVSEVGYFLSPRDLDRLLDVVADALADDGVVLLGHWRHEIEGWPLDGPQVHERFLADPRWTRLATYADDDVELLLLGPRGALPRHDA